jgi:Flp pilus assembly protein TadD
MTPARRPIPHGVKEMVARDMVSNASQTESGRRAGRIGRVLGSIGVPGRSRLGLAMSGVVAAAALGLGGYLAIRQEAPNADAVWEQAQVDLRANRLDRVGRAVAHLERLREPTPLDRLLRGQLAVALGRADQACAELSRVPDDHGLAAQARLLAGQIELRRDRFHRAVEALREAVRLDPKLVQAHRELIYIYGFQLRRADLSAEFLALSKLTDLSFSELFDWGLLRSESWEPSAAAETLARCVAADPGDRWSRLALAENQRKMSRLDQTEATLAALATDDPAAIAARVRIALERHDGAAAERLLGSGPSDDPELARLRGRLALSRRDAAAAARHFRIASRAEPESREGLSGLIAALTILGGAKALQPLRDLAARCERLDRLIQRAASEAGRADPDLPLRLGAACAALGHDAEARGWYKVAIARDPLDSRAQRALFRLGAPARDGPPAQRPGR